MEWRRARAAPGAPAPDDPGVPVAVPGTVPPSPDLDAWDWWYRGTVEVPDGGATLHFEGLTPPAEVWVDGAAVARSDNAWVPVRVPLPAGPQPVAVVFRSLQSALTGRRPRPRWKSALVAEQKLRFVRAPLHGRIPAWADQPTVGPWRAVRLDPARPLHTQTRWIEATLVDGTPRLRLEATASAPLVGAALEIDGRRVALEPDGAALSADLALPDLAPWWPHTHGAPRRTRLRLLLDAGAGEVLEDLGQVGFRTVSVDRSGGGFALSVNGRPVFAQGACWMPGADAAAVVAAAAAGGLNLIRVGGTVGWASDALVEACDHHGVLLWQDAPFANLDPPWDDPDFQANVQRELDHQLRRLQGRPCVAVVCGGSEVHQQAAMLGLPEAQWSSPLFDTALPQAVARWLPSLPVAPNTPMGGPLPFSTRHGLCHYYGVGAYRRPLTDARRAGVRFSPECLGFSNIGDEASLRADFGAVPPPHDPAWKAGVPRDASAGWDFEDIRDHYLRQLWGCDPVALRSRDPEGYRARSRLVPGLLMQRVFAEWRRPGSGCDGAAIWTLRDLRPGAGWGLFDHAGRPKATWWLLRRAWAPRAVLMTDEGLDGVDLHVHNRDPRPLTGEVELSLVRGSAVVASGRRAVSVPAFGALTLSGDAVLGRFTDATHAYRFGPPGHDAVVARLWVDGAVVHDDLLLPDGVPPGGALRAEAAVDGDAVVLTLAADAVLLGVHIEARGWAPDDDHLTLTPGHAATVRCRPVGAPRPFKAWVSAVNGSGGVTVRA